MTDTTPTHCGHDPRFVVSADEGTAYCAMCELEAKQAELRRIRGLAFGVLDAVPIGAGPCPCSLCNLAREIIG